MAVYAIGDLQGCYDPFRRLLDELAFEPSKDTLWLVGDIVNRGPKSLKALRFVRDLGDSAVTVLGNHDLHLLALHAGAVRFGRRFGTLEKLLNASDADELCDWLASPPARALRQETRHPPRPRGHTPTLERKKGRWRAPPKSKQRCRAKTIRMYSAKCTATRPMHGRASCPDTNGCASSSTALRACAW